MYHHILVPTDGSAIAEAAAGTAAQARALKVPCEEVLLTSGEPWEGIVDAARDNACDLIVMASNSRVGLERLFLGSVATEVLTHSRTPVLVCRAPRGT